MNILLWMLWKCHQKNINRLRAFYIDFIYYIHILICLYILQFVTQISSVHIHPVSNCPWWRLTAQHSSVLFCSLLLLLLLVCRCLEVWKEAGNKVACSDPNQHFTCSKNLIIIGCFLKFDVIFSRTNTNNTCSSWWPCWRGVLQYYSIKREFLWGN